MIDMTPEAQAKLDEYLRRTRGALRGSRTVESAEVEQSVQEHVELALEGAPQPVRADRLATVLEQLGPPERWLTDDDRPAWRRVLQQISTGPEDWRLAYLTFAAFALGLLLFPVGIGLVFLIVSFFLARADVDLVAARGEELGARRWLVIPPIGLVLLGFAFIVLILPVMGFAALGISDGQIHLVGGIPHTRPESAERVRVEAGYVGLVAGAWWLIVSPLLAALMRPVRSFFLPLTEKLSRRHAGVLAVIGAIVGSIGALLLFVVR